MQIFWLLMQAFSVFSCWLMAITFLRAWWHPMDVDGGRWVRFGVGVMILEFFTVHSGGILLGATLEKTRDWKKYLGLSVLILVYLVAAWFIAHQFQSITLLYSFGFILLSRLMNGFRAMSEQDVNLLTMRSATSGILYIAVVFLSVGIPFPAWGVTHRVLSMVYPDRGTEGIWEVEPQRALAAGVIYFAMMGLIEFFWATSGNRMSIGRRR